MMGICSFKIFLYFASALRRFSILAFDTGMLFCMLSIWIWQLDGNYQGRLTWGYFIIHPKYQANFGAKKSFLDGRLNASLKFTDLFRTSAEDLDETSRISTQGAGF